MSSYPETIQDRRFWPRRLGSALAAAVLGLAVMVASAAQAVGATLPDASANYSFATLDNPADTTFNQLLGINASGLIAGYYGSGMAGHPNKGYTLPNDGHGSYVNENVPGAAQTQVTGLNDIGVTVGFSADNKGDNSGFYSIGGHRFHVANYPTNNVASPAIDQLLGVNDHDIAVGFYNDSKGNAHGYTYRIATHHYGIVAVPGASSVSATAINNGGDIAGFDTNSSGTVEGFLLLNNGRVIHLNVPGSSMTQAFGVNDGDVVVGGYQVGTGKGAVMHGFVWAPGLGFGNVDDPSGAGATTVNGINDHGRLDGFYTDSSGNTDGFLATPQG